MGKIKIRAIIQTPKATVDETGKIRLTTEIRLEKSRRALVTILDEEPKDSFDLNVEMPTNESLSDEEVFGVWADRTETAQEIAREIRESNSRTK